VKFTYDGQSHAPTATAIGVLEGDTCTVTVTGEQVNAGTYTATASGLSDANYKLPVTKTKVFKIKRKTVELKWKNLKFTCDGKSHVPTATLTGILPGDTCTVTVTGEQTKAGTYKATASELSNPNYALPSLRTKTFKITR